MTHKKNLIKCFKNERVFFFHYNKPYSKSTGKPQISIHFGDTCYIVDNLIVDVKTYGKINKRQPFFVMKGKAKTLRIKNGIGRIS